MSCQPLDLDTIIEQLRTSVPGLQDVCHASALSAVKDLRGIRPGTAYVVLASERSETQVDGQGQRRVAGRQQVQATFGVIVAARNYRDTQGAKAMDDASPLIGATREALIGWTPDVVKFKQIFWVQGDVLDQDQSTLLWIDIFSTTHNIGGTP